MTDDEADALAHECCHYCQADEFTSEDRAAVRNRVAALRGTKMWGRTVVQIIERTRVAFREGSTATRQAAYSEAMAGALDLLNAANKGDTRVAVTATTTSRSKSRSKSHMGDKIDIKGDVANSAVGSSASFRGRDVSSYKSAVQSSGIDSDLAAVLVRAKEQLDAEPLTDGDAEDASDDLAKLTAELQKPEQDSGRIAALWQRIKAVTPTVATILAGAASIAKIIQAVGGH